MVGDLIQPGTIAIYAEKILMTSEGDTLRVMKYVTMISAGPASKATVSYFDAIRLLD
jgi:hypothetical protein